MIPRVVLLLLCTAPIAGAQREEPRIKVPEISADNSIAAVESARRRGAEKAAADINAGRAVILYYGEPWSGGKPLFDDATGLPVQIVGGCDVSEVFVSEVEAYNNAVRAWHTHKNPPPTP